MLKLEIRKNRRMILSRSTRRTNRRCCVYVLVLIISSGLLLACEGRPTEADMKASLETLAPEYWTKRFIDKDYKATYEMELNKDTLPYEKYLERVKNAGQISYLSVKTKDVKIEKDKAEVNLIVTCSMPKMPNLKIPLLDNWTFESNQWKHVLAKKSSKPIPMPILAK